tara:strand:+ start:813 stop:1262 length:450 start_codon:yes stop_codon:yes gene_type:complete
MKRLNILPILLNKILLVWFLAFMFLGASEVLAKTHSHGHHQKHLGSIVSPFDSHKNHASPHCLLMKGAHHQKDKCPHSSAKRDKTTRINIDCGGKTSGATPKTSSYSSDYAEAYLNPFVYPLQDKQITTTALFSYKQFIDLLEPPPRFV